MNPLSYIENYKYFLGMYPYGGDCQIRLYKKLNENHGQLLYSHVCKEITQKSDFNIYYSIETLIKKNMNNEIEKQYETKINIRNCYV